MIGASSHSIVATIMVAYAMSAIITGIVFMILGVFKLGNLIQFFPRYLVINVLIIDIF